MSVISAICGAYLIFGSVTVGVKLYTSIRNLQTLKSAIRRDVPEVTHLSLIMAFIAAFTFIQYFLWWPRYLPVNTGLLELEKLKISSDEKSFLKIDHLE